ALARARDLARARAEKLTMELGRVLASAPDRLSAAVHAWLASAQTIRDRLADLPDTQILADVARVLVPERSVWMDTPGRVALTPAVMTELTDAWRVRPQDSVFLQLPARLDGASAHTWAGAERTAALTALDALAFPPGMLPLIDLLRVEMTDVTFQTLSSVLTLLAAPDDLTRLRARRALSGTLPAGQLTQTGVEQLAQSAERPEAGYQVHTYCEWALKRVRHDRPDWLMAWADAGHTDILGRMHDLADDCLPVMGELLEREEATLLCALFDSIGWLWRLNKAKQETTLRAWTPRLWAAAAGDDESSRAAVRALGYLPGDAAGELRNQTVDQLLTRITESSMQAVCLTALARLALHAEPDQRERIAGHLAASATAAGRAALARLVVAGRADASLLTGVAPSGGERLIALLDAGDDDDVWDEYHKNVVRTAVDLLEQDEALLPRLLTHLDHTLHGDGWTRARIHLAVTAEAAQRMGDAFNLASSSQRLDDLLIRSARRPGSFTARLSALQAAGRLRVLSPGLLSALLDAAADIPSVYAAAIEAVQGFRHLSQDWRGEDALADLETALFHPSAARVALAARLMGALGRSPGLVQQPRLRQSLVDLLVKAYRAPQSHAIVYGMEGSRIQEKGTLRHAIFDALVQVVGLPE
ncbi:MAG: hypothetical protein KDD92_17630, partial [Caldilineaceae bacterium]|nr:hypothetical protein [Caldilineaceae bacterium]